MIILKIMGTLDLLAGIFLAFNIDSQLRNFIIYFCIIKGFWSIIASISANYYFDWMGMTDLMNGIGLLLLNFGISHFLFTLIGYTMIFKGSYILLAGFLHRK